jgi:6-phosphogluconate dehydrogenase
MLQASNSNLNNIAVIGLAPMGKNLAKNIASRGFKVSVYNRSHEKTDELLTENQENIIGFYDYKELVTSLEMPRKIIVMVKSGQPVDDFIDDIVPFMDSGDILIDCGNSNYKDTERRQKKLETVNKINTKAIHFIGCGVSGGWKGALNGPSIMPGGQVEAVEVIMPILKAIAAKDFNNSPCVTNVGLSGAGHFVKTVHNGIEYAIMQGIAEIYDILRQYSGGNQVLIEKAFSELNTGEIQSYLLDVTIEALQKEDENGLMLERVDFKAGAKGTGAWTVESALELGVAIPSIAASVMARIMSNHNQFFTVNKIDRIIHQDTNQEPQMPNNQYLTNALEAIYLTAYLQGLDLINKANEEYKWNINLDEVIRIWQGGCIIRSKMLVKLSELIKNGNSELLTEEIKKARSGLLECYDEIVQNLPSSVPYLSVFTSALDYCSVLLADKLPTNMTQLQRNIFGDHEIIIR